MNDIWQEIYIWVESYAGCAYDIEESIQMLDDPNIVFRNRFEWKITVEELLDDLVDIYDIIDEYGYLIPDQLPDASDMKQMYREKILGAVMKSLNDIKRQLHIQQIDLGDHRLIMYHVDVMYDLIDMLASNTMDTIIEKHLFEKYNEENDDAFDNLFGITKNDLSNMHETINSVIDDLSDDNDDDELFIDQI